MPLLTRDEDGQRRYSTAELLATERRALALAEHLRRQPGAPMDAAVVAAATEDSRLSAEQAEVIRQLADSAGLTLIVGPAGTGKTAALAAAHKAWQAAGVDVQGTALAAVTARRLADATGIPSCSLARLLADADQPDPATGQPRGLHPGGVVVLDEAGIVDTRKLCALFTHAARSRTALVLVGDPRQLPEIEAGGLFTQLAQSPRTLHLTDNRRQQDGWERDALARLRAGNIDPAIDAYTAHGRIHHSDRPRSAASRTRQRLPPRESRRREPLRRRDPRRQPSRRRTPQRASTRRTHRPRRARSNSTAPARRRHRRPCRGRPFSRDADR